MDSMFSNVPIFGLIVLFIGTVVAEAPYIVYWIATFFITFFIGMMFRVSGLKKIGIWIGLFLVLNIPPLVVPVYSYYQFVSLCKIEGYYKIYDTVELGPEHWDERGRARFFRFGSAGASDYRVNDIIYRVEDFSKVFSDMVRNYKIKIISNKKKKVYMEYSNVSWWPERFPFVSAIYRSLKIESCVDLDGKDIPSVYAVRDIVFIKESRNEK